MDRSKLNHAWETLRAMPMPAIASDRLVDLHNDVTHYDTAVSDLMKTFLNSDPVPPHIAVDHELGEALRIFKATAPEEVACRRDLLAYKRHIDAVVIELQRLIGGRS